MTPPTLDFGDVTPHPEEHVNDLVARNAAAIAATNREGDPTKGTVWVWTADTPPKLVGYRTAWE